MTKKLPVHIITGFLGSGKTTFLNQLIKERASEKILVIENECGDTNVDGALIMKEVNEVVELSAGCLCCTLSKELHQVLQEVSKKSEAYDRLVIETTGIADPSSIIQTFLEDPFVEGHFDLQQVICLTDASQIHDWLKDTEEALRQISLSDCILINKADLVSKVEVEKVETLVKGIHPNARAFSGSNGIFPIDEIFEIGTTRPATVESVVKHDHHHHEHSVDNNNAHKITTFTLNFPFPLQLEKITVELDRIVNLYRHQVYRVKGFIAIPDYPNRVILQSARSVFIATDGTPWAPDETQKGYLVFIGRDLKREVFEKMFNKYMQVA